MRDSLIAAFAQPNVEGFIFWGYWDKAFYAGESNLFYDKDFNLKPGGEIYQDLVYNKWWTRDAKATTDASGKATVRGFYGDYDITIHHDNECDERYLLHVAHQVDIYMNTIDTTLCQGRIFEYEGIEYTTDTTFWDTAWVNVDLRKSVEVTISFTAPEMEYDSVVVPTADLQAGYYYALADTYIYTEGTYFYELLKHNECTRHITLTVIEDVTSGLANPQVSHAARLVIINGMIFVQNGQDIYTILGEKITDNVIIKY